MKFFFLVCQRIWKEITKGYPLRLGPSYNGAIIIILCLWSKWGPTKKEMRIVLYYLLYTVYTYIGTVRWDMNAKKLCPNNVFVCGRSGLNGTVWMSFWFEQKFWDIDRNNAKGLSFYLSKDIGLQLIYNPLQWWGFQQCLSFSWTTQRYKHFRHPIAIMGVVDTFRHNLIHKKMIKVSFVRKIV